MSPSDQHRPGAAAQVAESLQAAAETGDLAALAGLLDAGADPDFPSASGEGTALAEAVAAQNLALVQLLVAAGADPTLDYGSQASAVERSLYGGSGMGEIREALRSARPRRIHDKMLIGAADLGAPGMVEHAIALGADVEARDEFGHTAVIVAAETNQAEVGRILLSRGADPNAGNADGTRTALTAAIVMGNLLGDDSIVRLLIASGADVNKTVREGYDEVTPLALASSLGAEAIVRLLREAGAGA